MAEGLELDDFYGPFCPKPFCGSVRQSKGESSSWFLNLDGWDQMENTHAVGPPLLPLLSWPHTETRATTCPALGHTVGQGWMTLTCRRQAGAMNLHLLEKGSAVAKISLAFECSHGQWEVNAERSGWSKFWGLVLLPHYDQPSSVALHYFMKSINL